MCLSRNARIVKEKVAPLGIASVKLFSYAAQTIFSNKRAFEYFTHSTSHPLTTVATSLGVVAGAITTYVAKIPPIFETLNPQDRHREPPQPTPEVHFGWRGNTANFIFTKASLCYGTLSAFVAYSTSLVLMSSIMAAFDDTASWTKTVLKQVAGAVIFVGMLFAYYSYDYQYSKNNAYRLSNVIDSGDFSCNKTAMTKTILAAGLNLFTFTATAYFWGRTGSQALITSDSAAAKFAVSAITAIGCSVTFLTVLTWLPSAYKAFLPQPPLTEIETREDNCATLAVKSAKYISGIPDSLLNQGLSSFMGVILLMQQLFGTDPYNRYVIALAALCLLTSATINYVFSVKPGADALVKRIQEGYYTKSNICYGLFGSLRRTASQEKLLSGVADEEGLVINTSVTQART